MPSRNVILSILILIGAGGCAYLHGNFQTVEPGKVYRSGQLSPEGLERRLEKHSIRTVVSLRKPDTGEAWYQDEVAVCEDQGVEHYALGWSMNELPPPESLQQLLEIYERDAEAILVHCQGGTHRAAIASAVFLLAKGAPLEQARGELGVFFNDAPIGELLDLYEGSEVSFKRWAVEIYPEIYDTRAFR